MEINDKNYELSEKTPLELASNVHGLLAVKKDGSAGAVGLEEIANEAGKKVGDAVKIVGNVLPTMGDVNKRYSVTVGAEGLTLTYNGVPFVLTPSCQVDMFWDALAQTWEVVNEVPLPAPDLSGYATKQEIESIDDDLQGFNDKILEQPENYFDKSTVIEGHYIDATSGELRPVTPNNSFAVSDWEDLPVGETEMYISGNTASPGTVFRNSAAPTVLIKPIDSVTGLPRPTYARNSNNGLVIIPSGANQIMVTVKFNNIDARNTLVLEKGNRDTTRIRESLIPKLEEVVVLNNQMNHLLYEGEVTRQNRFENTVNPQYFDDVSESNNRFKITVVADDTSPTKDLLNFKRVFSNTLTANGATCYQYTELAIGSQRPDVISIAMWINKAQFQSIFTGNITNYIGFRSYGANVSLLLTGQTVISSPADTTPIAEYTTAKAEFKIIEEINGWIRLRITYFDIQWKSSFTGTTVRNYFHFSGSQSFNKSLDISDFTCLYNESVQAGVFYSDPDGNFKSNVVSVPALNDGVNSLNTRVSALEQGDIASGGMNVKFNGDSLFIGSPYSSDRQLVKRITHFRPTSFTNNPNVNFISSYLASFNDIEISLTAIKSEGDDICPLSANGGHIAGNHGWFKTYILTVSAGHGKGFADIGSIYKDANNIDIVIIKIISATQILVNSRNQANDGITYDFRQPSGTLVYSSNGLNTGSIAGYTSAGGGNMWPSTMPSITKFFADRKEVGTTFNGKCDVFDINETYAVIDLASMIEKLISGRPSTGYTANIYFNEVGADVLFTVNQVYRYESNGNTVVMQNVYANKRFKYDFNSVIQVIAPATGNMYVPKSLPITGGATTYDFRKITPWSVDPTVQLYLTPEYWENPSNPPDRGVMLNDNIVIHSGYLMSKGMAINRIGSVLAHAAHLANSRKFYPKIFATQIIPDIGNSYSAVAFRSYKNPVDNPNGRTNYSYVELSGVVNIWLDYHGTLEDIVKIKPEWYGKTIEIVEKTNNVNIVGDVAVGDLNIKSKADADNYGYIVLRLK
ncbi:hypothetical protein KO02_17430 [Sphingobacterium sp. ML3W]|uniref:hypothetical protein n=1 Tax=Sphingobacterium sp. ML3W TaxID=1538644 RepID=UPI0004F87D9F|nr:hypothetical protein [Sphingobacterium sp. ML3W]AIM38266.1 hypothetical protein KO02_17430 [Sphingobacterium sp. ML3W]